MSDQSNIGKGFLKDKLGEYQVHPPETVWNSIASRLGVGNRRRMYVLLLATAASLALAISLGIHFWGPGPVQEASLAEDSQVRKDTRPVPGKQHMDELLKPADADAPQGLEKPEEIRARDREGLRSKVVEALASVSGEEDRKGEESIKLASAEQETKQDPGPDPMGEFQVEPTLEPDPESTLQADPESAVEADAEQSRESDPQLESAETGVDTLPVLRLDSGEGLPLDAEPLTELDQKKDPRWMLGAVMSPLYSFRDADGQAMAGGSEYESGLLSYAGGINVSYRGNSRLAIESGIHISKMGIAIGAPGIQLFNRSDLDAVFMPEANNSPELIAITNSIGNIVTESGDVVVNGYKLNARYGEAALSNPEVGDFVQVAEQGIEQHLDYLEVPFNLRYTVVDRAFELQVVGGLSTNFLINNTVTMETSSGDTDIGYLTNIRNVNYSGNAGIGMIYHIHRRFSFLLEPRFRYFLNSVNDQSLPATRPYTLGIYTGINYTF